MLMFRSTHEKILELIVNGNAEINSLLRQQVLEQKTLVAVLQDKLALAEAKVERMELVLMPLSSAAGAAYVAETRHATRVLPPSAALADDTLDWSSRLRKFMADSDLAAATKAQKEHQDGFPV